MCVTSAREHGADEAFLITQSQLKLTDFYRDNQKLLDQPRGIGFWAWKPYILLDLMKGMSDGAIAIYLDAGVQAINNLKYVIDRMDQDIFLFGNMHEHAHWCKRDIIEAIMPWTPPDSLLKELGLTRKAVGNGTEIYLGGLTEEQMYRWRSAPWDRFGKQAQASAIFMRVTSQTKAFVQEWLDWCLFDGGRLIDDSPSRTPNHVEFAENRYDQSILTSLQYREGVDLHWWPASYQGGSTYPRGFKENRHDQAILTTMAYRDKIALHKWAVKYDLGGQRFFEHEQGHYEDDYPVLFFHHRRRNHEWENAD